MKRRPQLWKQQPVKMITLQQRTTQLRKLSFKYLGAVISGNNDWNSEICNRINKVERVLNTLN